MNTIGGKIFINLIMILAMVGLGSIMATQGVIETHYAQAQDTKNEGSGALQEPKKTPKSEIKQKNYGGMLGPKGTVAGYIPDCSKIEGQCSDISVFLITAIGLGRYVFAVIGAIALVMFVYGGLVLITSHGNAEKVKQGTGIFVSAVIGLVIVFSAYMLVKFFGDSIVNIDTQYRLK